MASSRASLAVVLAVLLLGSVASAAPTAAERETARRLMDEGKARMKANDYPRAVDAIRKANDIMHVPTTGLALARAELAAGKLVEARDAAIAVARMPHEPGEPAVFDSARKQARELDAQLLARIPTLRLRIKGTASRITIDDVDVPLATAGQPRAVNPGKRSVVVSAADGGEARGEPTLAERDAKELELVVTPVESTKPAPLATAATSPREIPDERSHGERTTLATGLVYGGFAIGVLGLGAGALAGVLTLSKANKVDPQCANDVCAPAAKSDLDAAKTFGTIATIGFAVGAAGIVLGVVGLVLPRSRHVAWLGPNGVAGTF